MKYLPLFLLFIPTLGWATDPVPASPIIRFPELVAPTPPVPPKPDPSVPVVLPPGVLYVFESDTDLMVDAFPEGLLSITKETGPVRFYRNIFIDGNGKPQTRTYKAKNVYVVEAIGDGTASLVVVPVGATTRAQWTVKAIDANVAPRPPPTPPDPPKPPTPPPSPAPIPDAGLRVLFVYDPTTIQTLPQAQIDILYSSKVTDYLEAKCVAGPSGKAKEWRNLPLNVDLTGESSIWQKAMARPRASVPWLLISNGKTGYEGPLPPSITATLELLKKYEVQ